MSKRRLTTDEPHGMFEHMCNITKVIDREIYLRDFCGEDDKSLIQYCKEQCKYKCNHDNTPGIWADEFGEYIHCNCVVAYFYFLAVGHAELRQKLCRYEDEEEFRAELLGKIK